MLRDALRAAVSTRDVEAELIADAARAAAGPRTAAASDEAPSGVNVSRASAQSGVEALLDLRPLIGSSHRRISIMAAR